MTTEAVGTSRRILAFPFHDWRKSQIEGFRTRDAHLLEVFGKRADVKQLLVIDRPVSTAERLLRRSPAHVSGVVEGEWSSGGVTARMTRVGPRTMVLDMAVRDMVAPVLRRRGWWFDVFARPDVGEAIDRAVLAGLAEATDAVAWVPAVAPVLFRSGVRTIYDSLDNWLIHPELRRNSVEAAAGYAAILPRADRVFVSAPASASALATWRPDAVVLPNGVDPTHFAGHRPRPIDLPPTPVVGYAGKLADRIDDDLVVRVADELPDVHFVFVGPVLRSSAVQAMRGHPNVVVLGDRPYDKLPAYVRAFDVASISHRVGAGETGGDPIKLYEYWAAGRQVVSTRIDGSGAWAAQAWLVDDADEAAAAIRGLLSGALAPLPTIIPVGRTWDEIAGVLLGEEPDRA